MPSCPAACHPSSCNNVCCRGCSRIGLRVAHVHRKKLYTLAFCTTTIALCFAIIGALGYTNESDLLMDIHWAKGKISNVTVGGNATDDFEVYMDISATVVKRDGKTYSKNFGDINCDASQQCDSFQDCADSATGLTTTIFMNCITKLPALMTIYYRRNELTDNRCKKFMSILTGFLGIATVISPLSEFRSSCYLSLNDEEYFQILTEEGALVSGTADYSLGPGFICMCIALIFEVPAFIINILVPLPPEKPVEEFDAQLD